MYDLISRQAALDAVFNNAGSPSKAYKAIRILPSAQPEQRWIPVSERIPEWREPVLTYIVNGDMKINFVIDEEDKEWFYDGVIAWMYLPEPYKESKDVSDD